MALLRQLSWLGTATSMALILVLTLTPVGVGVGAGAEGVGGEGCALGLPCVLGHAVVFSPLGVSLAGVFVTSGFARRSPRRALSMLFLALWIFAALTELAQAEVGRDPSLGDWVADMIGAIVGLVAGGFALRMALADRLPASVPAPRASRPRSRAKRR